MSYLQMEGWMDDLILNVNWLATLLGAALAHLVGWAWYSQTFFWQPLGCRTGRQK